MAQETYDWSSDYMDEESGGTTSFTSASGDSVDITLSQPDPGGYYYSNGDGYESQTQGGSSGGHFQIETNFSDPSQTTSTTIDFSSNTASAANSITDPSFTLFDLDSPASGGYQDQVTILAYDELGNLLPVTLTAVDSGAVSISGSTATAIVGGGTGGSQPGNIDATSTQGNVIVSISGDVSQIVIVYGNGSGANSNPTPQQIGISDLTFDLQPSAVCFVRGTQIGTPDGPTVIEDLRVGDYVTTADHGPQQIRWIGRQTVSGMGRLAPVSFARGAIGNEYPLNLSPQHRVMLSGLDVSAFTGEDEVLVTALHMVNGTTIIQESVQEVEYFHLMFDEHEIVYAEGSPCESLFISTRTLKSMGQAGRDEIERLFPEIYHRPHLFGSAARLCLQAYETQVLLCGMMRPRKAA